MKLITLKLVNRIRKLSFQKANYCLVSMILIITSLTAHTSELFESDNKIIVGAERFSDYQAFIENKRLALVVNQTSRVNEQHLVDFLLEEKAQVLKIFAPEHGFRGEKGAGETIKDNKDVSTGLPVFSLYGKNKKPSEDRLKDIDALVFDIQDVGVRFYSYISTMHYVMEACAENNIPLLVFDRPNPNGDYIDGPILDKKYQSFVGMHELPIVHGLTVAELALMINGEGWLEKGKQCELTVIPVTNYDHRMPYSLPIKPSPNLPNDLSIRLYPTLALFEATEVSVGRGTNWPFQVLGFPDSQMGDFKFRPRKITGSWADLNHSGQTLFGQHFTQAPQSGLSLAPFLKWYAEFQKSGRELISRPDFLDKLTGSSYLRESVQAGLSEREIKRYWAQGLNNYQILRMKYLLYPDHPQILRHVVSE